MGLSKQVFTSIWQEGSTPSLDFLILVQKKTGVSLDWLLDTQANPPKNSKENPSQSMKEEYEDTFVEEMYEKARSICWQDDSDEKIMPATEDELSKLTEVLCQIFTNYRRRQLIEDEEQSECLERMQASEQAEEEAIKKHHSALKSAEMVAADQRRKASVRARIDAVERRQDAEVRARGKEKLVRIS
ncbi:MAG: hypothetical protein HQL72_06410 [Magnetococcales bacterium]|nr:hypothetical protein [Magnetococcales bacterium]